MARGRTWVAPLPAFRDFRYFSPIMSSLVQELQQDALDNKVPVSTLLRKALVVASKLGISDADDWMKAGNRPSAGGLS